MNNSKNFYSYLNQSLSNDISYEELSNLCLTLYCNTSILPEKFNSLDLNKEELAIIFSKIARERKIISYPPTASFYGASFHNSHDIGHWLEVMASVLKLANEANIEEAKKTLQS